MSGGHTLTRILILGAAGRDFHNFNVPYRRDAAFRVVAFTAAQIPGIAGPRYPPSLAGPLYPQGIPIEDETQLETICRRELVDLVVFAYSDASHPQVMHRASRALATGADFALLGPARTMLHAHLPVIAISAIRTGCGKSQVARWLGRRLRGSGLRVAVLRHPMPYGDLERKRVQRFASRADHLLFVTDVPCAFERFGAADQEPIRRMNVDEARAKLAQGMFIQGSMGPKVESAGDYVVATGKSAVITMLGQIEPARRGVAGTTISPD